MSRLAELVTLRGPAPCSTKGMCPHCRQLAPVVFRGARAFCTACDQPRSPFGAKVVNLAGGASRVSGALTRGAGFTIGIVGVLLAIVVGALLQAIFPMTVLGWVVGGVFALAAALAGWVMVRGGDRLMVQGAARLGDVRIRALRAFAERHGGAITAADASSTLDVTEAEADEALMGLARRGEVAMDFDDTGRVHYRFHERDFADRVRVAMPGERLATFEDVADEELPPVTARRLSRS